MDDEPIPADQQLSVVQLSRVSRIAAARKGVSRYEALTKEQHDALVEILGRPITQQRMQLHQVRIDEGNFR